MPKSFGAKNKLETITWYWPCAIKTRKQQFGAKDQLRPITWCWPCGIKSRKQSFGAKDQLGTITWCRPYAMKSRKELWKVKNLFNLWNPNGDILKTNLYVLSRVETVSLVKMYQWLVLAVVVGLYLCRKCGTISKTNLQKVMCM